MLLSRLVSLMWLCFMESKHSSIIIIIIQATRMILTQQVSDECRQIYQQFRASKKGKQDIHTRLMARYNDIPDWWFHLTLVISVAISLLLCIFKNHEVQLPWWGLLFACALALLFTLPVSIISATTNQVCIYLTGNSRFCYCCCCYFIYNC